MTKKSVSLALSIVVGSLGVSTPAFASDTLASSVATYEFRCNSGEYMPYLKVNMRSKPSLSGKIKGTIPKGVCLTQIGNGATDERGVYWVQVKYKGKTGWISTNNGNVGTAG